MKRGQSYTFKIERFLKMKKTGHGIFTTNNRQRRLQDWIFDWQLVAIYRTWSVSYHYDPGYKEKKQQRAGQPD
jgi:hypothetical protein